MNPVPTGRITQLDDGSHDLVVTRNFAHATVEDVWESITDPERTARWYGPWRGDAGIGKSIEVQMAYEEGAPWMTMQIDACDPPHQLALSAIDEYGSWFLELRIHASGSGASLDLIHHKLDPGMADSMGPGWEYYMDMLVAARLGTTAPQFDDYYPSQSAYFADQVKTG